MSGTLARLDSADDNEHRHNRLHSPAPNSSSSQQQHTITKRTLAAARQSSLRLTLISILAEKPASLRLIKSILSQLSMLAPQLRTPSTNDELIKSIHQCATYKSPGLYHLKPGVESEMQSIDLSTHHDEDLIQPSHKRQKIVDRECLTPTKPSTCDYQASPLSSGMTTTLQGTPQPSTSMLHPHATRAAPIPPTSPHNQDPRDGDIPRDDAIIPRQDGVPPQWPKITSIEGYRQAHKEYAAKYVPYTRLRQSLDAHLRDIAAFRNAIDRVTNEALKQKYRDDKQKVLSQRAERVTRWRSEYSALHEELLSIRKEIFDYEKNDARDAAPHSEEGQEYI